MHQATWMVHHIKNDAGHSVNSTGQMDQMQKIWKDASHFFSRKAFRPTSFFKKNESFGNQIVGVIFQERHQEVNRESNCCLSFPLHASWVWFVKNWFVKTSKSTVRSGSNPITRQIGDSPWSSTKCSHVMILRALPFADLNKQSRRKNSWENG